MKKQTVFLSIIIISILFLSSCTSDFSFSYTGDYCEDGLQDRDEEDVDCGGQYCDPCGESASCNDDDDCDSGSCVDDVCAAGSSEADSDEDGIADSEDYCTDSDGPSTSDNGTYGYDFYEKGTASGIWSTTGEEKTDREDFCDESGYLSEYFCKADGYLYYHINIECPSGYTCSDGACV